MVSGLFTKGGFAHWHPSRLKTWKGRQARVGGDLSGTSPDWEGYSGPCKSTERFVAAPDKGLGTAFQWEIVADRPTVWQDGSTTELYVRECSWFER